MSMTSGAMVMQRIVYDGAREEDRHGRGGRTGIWNWRMPGRARCPFPEVAYPELDYGAFLNGVVEVDGRKCNRLLVKKAAGGAFTEYYDAESGSRCAAPKCRPANKAPCR